MYHNVIVRTLSEYNLTFVFIDVSATAETISRKATVVAETSIKTNVRLYCCIKFLY